MLFFPQDDFDLDRIAESGQCFRWEPLEDGGYRIPFRNSCLHIRDTENGKFELDCSVEEFQALWRDYFDLDTDYSGIRARVDKLQDPFLYCAAQAEQGIRILRQDPWETLVSFIISQNRNIPAIRRSIDRDGGRGHLCRGPSPGGAELRQCPSCFRRPRLRRPQYPGGTGFLPF